MELAVQEPHGLWGTALLMVTLSLPYWVPLAHKDILGNCKNTGIYLTGYRYYTPLYFLTFSLAAIFSLRLPVNRVFNIGR
jgi:hypothetical protein